MDLQVNKDICNVVATGSTGNCVIYHRTIAVDIGISYSKISPYAKDLKIIVLSHKHLDHLNIKTLKRLQANRPTLRIFCGSWMTSFLSGLKNIDVCDIGLIYNYGEFKLSPIKLYHDTKNIGVRIFKDNHRTLHVTDTCHLDGITAKHYDLLCIESNFDEDKVAEAIKIAEANNEFCYVKDSINTHLSHRQAWEFVEANKKPDTIWIKLHMSQKYS